MDTSAANESPHAETLFERAVGLWQAGQFPQAERTLRSVLEIDSRQADALHLLGIVCSQLGRHDEALGHIQAALQVEPGSADVHMSSGNVLAALNRFDESLASFDRAIALDPQSALAYSNRGNAQQALGQFEAAIASYDRAISFDPQDADAYYGRGNTLGELTRFEEAVTNYDKAIELRPDHVQALINRGLALQRLRRLDEGAASFDRAIAFEPNLAEAWNNRGNALHEMRRFDEALASYDQAVTLRPAFAEAWNNRGAALHDLNRFDEAIASYDRALAIRPDHARAFNCRGDALRQKRRFADALTDYDKAIALEPDYAQAWFNRGVALQELKRLEDAVKSYDKAMAFEPDFADASLINRGQAFQEMGRLDEALTSFGRAIGIRPDNIHAFGRLATAAKLACDWPLVEKLSSEVAARAATGNFIEPFTLLGYSSDPALQLACAKAYIAHKVPIRPPHLWNGEIWRNPKIRIAYLGTGFHQHPTAYLTAELLEIHDRARFDVLGISLGPDDGSAIRRRLIRAFDEFHDVRSQDNRETAKLIHDLRIDILIDRSGYTSDARPEILAYRPAPIQVSYIGFPGTLGADFYDYVIADPIVLPSDQRRFYAEEIVHLPDCYLVNDSTRLADVETPSRKQMDLPEQGFVFCCFSNSYKITASLFDIWMRLLDRVEGSVLWLISWNKMAETNLRKAASARGIDSTRLIFANRVKPEQHLARHRLADLFLDTLPYNAHTTASDALWMGLPLVTCCGEAFAGRVSASLLNAIGLPELVTRSLEEYESLAIRLASHPPMLRELRRKLQQNLSTYPLFDAKRYRNHIEAAYTSMWGLWQRGELPRSFAVEPLPTQS